MSYTSILINGRDVTRFVTDIGHLREYNDESNFFAGVVRRSNLDLELDNTDGRFNKSSIVFSGDRNDIPVQIIYHSSDPGLNPYFVFSGVINEGSTANDLESRHIKLTVLDYLKFLDSEVIRVGNQTSIDSLYRGLRASNARLNKHFIACFLYFFLRKENNKLNKIFNVFNDNVLRAGSYPTINATIESIFPPSDGYYSEDNNSALSVLNRLCASINSYLFVENLEDKSQLFIKARPTASQSQKTIRETNILKFSQQTDGFNKLYNSITINESRAYTRQDSIDRYGVRVVNITSYAPASQALADTYLDYYSQPRPELDCVVKLRNEMLDIKVGDSINIDLPSRPDLTVQGLKGEYFVIARTVNFSKETIILRLRGVT